MRPKRILMNAADASPGGSGGAAPSPTNAPAPGPAAQPGPTEPTQAQKDALVKQGRDAAYAELRRSGALKRSYLDQEQPKGDKPGTTQNAAPDVSHFRRLDRAIVRTGRSIDERAYGRMERAFVDESPDDVDTWVGEYFTGLGAAPAATTTTAPVTQQQQTTAQIQKPPVTDRGGPAASQVPIDQQDMLSMSATDLEALLKQIGPLKYREKFAAAISNRSISIRRK